MRKRGTRAQASFEYIVIYGWATLIILGSIGILYSFDLLNFNSFVGDKCTFYGQADCFESQVISDPTNSNQGNMTVVLQNKFGTDLVVFSIGAYDEFFSCTAEENLHELWPNNQRILLSLECGSGTDDFIVNSRTETQISVTYYRNISICNDGINPIAPECLLTTVGTLEQTIEKPYS